MKKCLCLIIILALSISIFSPISYIVKNNINVKAESEQNIYYECAYILHDKLYVLTNDSVICFNDLNSKPETVVDLKKAFGDNFSTYEFLLTADENNLYLINTAEANLYKVNDDKVEFLVALDTSKCDKDASTTYMFSYPIIIDENLYLLSRDPKTYDNSLLSFSIKNGESKALETSHIYLEEIKNYKNSQILIPDNNHSSIVIYDPVSMSVSKEIAKSDTAFFSEVAYDDKSDKLFYFDNDNLFMIQNTDTTKIARLVTEQIQSKCCFVWDNAYLTLKGGKLYTVPLNSNTDVSNKESTKATINIYYPENYYTDIPGITEYKLAHNDIEIKFKSFVSENVGETLTATNLSKDDKIDIFVIDNTYMDNDIILSKNFSSEINSEFLKENVMSMYDQIKDFCMKDGKLYSYPINLEIENMAVDTELLNKAGYNKIPETYIEYIDMLNDWYSKPENFNLDYAFDDNYSYKSEISSMALQLLKSYILTYADKNAPISFNTDIFKNTVMKLKKIAELKDNNPNTEDSFYNGPSIFKFQTISSPFNKKENTDFYPIPGFEKGKHSSSKASLFYLIINPSSKNKEIATEILEYCAKYGDNIYKCMLNPNLNEAIPYESYIDSKIEYDKTLKEFQDKLSECESKLKDLESNKNTPESNIQILEQTKTEIENLKEAISLQEESFKNQWEDPYEISESAIKAYRAYAPYMNFKFKSYIDEISFTNILSYIDGDINLEEMINSLDDDALMLYTENN